MPVLTWDDILKFNIEEPQSPLTRKSHIQRAYDARRKELSSANKPIDKYIMEQYFSTYPKMGFIITENEFPYETEDEIVHLLLWVHPDHKMTIQEARDYVTGVISSNEHVIFQNKPSNCSIRQILHYHVFVKVADKHQLLNFHSP